MKNLFFAVLLLCCNVLFAQDYFPKHDGVKSSYNAPIAFTNATIFVNSTKAIKQGTLVVYKGKVTGVGKGIEIPKNAIKINLEGKHIYPSFIDVYSSFGIEKPKRAAFSRTLQLDATREGYYWNDHIRPETNPIDYFKFDNKASAELLKAGFGVVNTHVSDGIVRGNGMLVALNANASNSKRILDHKSAQYLSFRKSSKSNQMYPNSLMGAMALLRQLYIDADWYAKGNIETNDLSLEALNNNKNLVQIFDAGKKLNVLRADKVGDEFGIQYTILGGGDEYENVAEIKKTGATLILPLKFRDVYDVSNPNLVSSVEVADMRKWNQEPTNPKVLDENNVSFSLTTHNLKKVADFSKNLKKAIEYGFNKTSALNSLTTIPAKILGKENEIGTLDVGKQANFLITSDEIFSDKTVIYENWVQGTKNVINDMSLSSINGDYTLNYKEKSLNVSISGKDASPKIVVKQDSTKLNSKILRDNDWVTLIFSEKDATDFVRLKAKIDSNSKKLSGNGIDENENTFNWEAISKETVVEGKKSSTDKESIKTPISSVTFPNQPFGFKEKPTQQNLLFKNVTVWTGEAEGILKNTDVLIIDGKISKIGIDLKSSKATIVNGKGKHLTAGIIDEHSHIASEGVNEVGHNSTAEVTIEDVVVPDDTNIYRSLAGGVTTVQILHGSANPIGGRSALIKLKWGETADGLLYKNNDKFIKFALGENVKRSSWGPRFPQTRMGVEQMMTDYFQRAREYDNIKKSGQPFRRDIELETLAQILNGERFITCHSYVQSEINMLMKVADKFNFTINTFTHILEGYKVADKMKDHNVGASTFSDWWAYKYEVIDAIPYNASILHNAGVTVAINSDDDEMQRRLNQEAAKTVKYGGVSEEEAWKFVTLNPAKLLHIDDKVGSIKVGKDADLVLWSDHPLSIYAKPEKTLIEGVVYFDKDQDKILQEEIKLERNSLINLMLKEKIKGAPTQKPVKNIKKQLHCDTVTL